ncbi:O-methyltransferase [Actinokineospora enzanensis]|uniref:O-methyltransferase n=1 Tax=Actinokineospora enzanensis TaxID=155975 RepID=UPI00039D72E9|nr:O-methyltransferase [Actinokineospora enzanensis]
MTYGMDVREPMRVPQSAEIIDYVVRNGARLDDAHRFLIDRTRELFGDRAGMQIAPEQGALISLLTRLIGARKAVEVGTFTGYSALCIATGLPADGELLCCDISEEWTGLAREGWRRAGVDDRIRLRIGPALDTLRGLPDVADIDLSFIDADKPGYRAYYEELLRRTRPGGLILLDNVLFGGRVLDPAADGPAAALRELNPALAADDRVDLVVLPLADGLTLARKR